MRLAGTKSLSQPHYLALIHLFDRKTGRYAHHAYRFQGEPPFMCPGGHDACTLRDVRISLHSMYAPLVYAYIMRYVCNRLLKRYSYTHTTYAYNAYVLLSYLQSNLKKLNMRSSIII